MKRQPAAFALCWLLVGFATESIAQDASTVRPGTVLAGSTKPDVAGAQRELTDLRELLFGWASRSDWPGKIGVAPANNPLSEALDADPCPAISSRLALFRARYGIDFRDAPGWAELAALAGATYDRLIAEFPAPGTARFGDRWTSPAWTAVRALLLDVAGRGDDATEVLFGDCERYWDGCCVGDLSEDLFYLARARADQLDRAGDSAGALRWLHEACFRWGEDAFADMFGRPRIASDLVLARYSMLLADSGELEAAHAVFRTLETRMSDSLGLSVARTVLGERLAGVSASTTNVFGVPLPGTEDAVTAGSTVFVVGDGSDVSTWRVLACSLPRWPERKLARRMAPDCATDLTVVDPTDPRARPLVKLCLGQR